MELKDTATLMVSSDYKERFKAEYYQLKIRLEKLKCMLQKWDNGKCLNKVKQLLSKNETDTKQC